MSTSASVKTRECLICSSDVCFVVCSHGVVHRISSDSQQLYTSSSQLVRLASLLFTARVLFAALASRIPPVISKLEFGKMKLMNPHWSAIGLNSQHARTQVEKSCLPLG